MDVTDIPLRQLTGFQSYNTRDGINLWAHKTNFDGQLLLDSPSPQTAHNLRSTIDGFKVWGVRGTGVKVQYSSYTDIKNGLIIGNPDQSPWPEGFSRTTLPLISTSINCELRDSIRDFKIEFPNASSGFYRLFPQQQLFQPE